MFGIQELVVIFLIVLILFGGRKLPEIARGLGKGIREFKKARDNLESSLDTEDQKDLQEPQPPANPPDKEPETRD